MYNVPNVAHNKLLTVIVGAKQNHAIIRFKLNRELL